MENYDILIKNCQVLNPDMNVSSTCSVGIKDTWIKKIGSADEFVDSVATETLDGKGVKIVCLFSVQAGDNSGNQHLKMLSLVAGKLGKKEVVEALLNANTVDDLEAAFM